MQDCVALWRATKSRSLPWVAFLGLAANESLMRIGQKKHGSLDIDDIMSTLTSLKSVDINALQFIYKVHCARYIDDLMGIWDILADIYFHANYFLHAAEAQKIIISDICL